MRSSRLHRPLSLASRCIKLARLAVHLFSGLVVAFTRYPGYSTQRRRAAMRQWSSRLLGILGMRVARGSHPPLPICCLLVSNHVSWTDIVVIASRFPAVFVAKSEIRNWPLVGTLCHRAGTVFIERGSHSSARDTNRRLQSSLADGPVAVFPEGTTTHGDRVGHFHSALFQPVIDAQGTVQPLAIRYLDEHNQICDAPNFVGDTSFMGSLWRLTAERRVLVQLRMARPIAVRDVHRRQLADQVKVAIQKELDALPGREPGTSAGPPAESR